MSPACKSLSHWMTDYSACPSISKHSASLSPTPMTFDHSQTPCQFCLFNSSLYVLVFILTPVRPSSTLPFTRNRITLELLPSPTFTLSQCPLTSARMFFLNSDLLSHPKTNTITLNHNHLWLLSRTKYQLLSVNKTNKFFIFQSKLTSYSYLWKFIFSIYCRNRWFLRFPSRPDMPWFDKGNGSWDITKKTLFLELSEISMLGRVASFKHKSRKCYQTREEASYWPKWSKSTKDNFIYPASYSPKLALLWFHPGALCIQGHWVAP